MTSQQEIEHLRNTVSRLQHNNQLLEMENRLLKEYQITYKTEIKELKEHIKDITEAASHLNK